MQGVLTNHRCPNVLIIDSYSLPEKYYNTGEKPKERKGVGRDRRKKKKPVRAVRGVRSNLGEGGKWDYHQSTPCRGGRGIFQKVQERGKASERERTSKRGR